MLDSMPTSPVSTEISRPLPARNHEHSWLTESRHAVSEGLLLYVRCSICGARRVDLKPHAMVHPTGISNVIQSAGPVYLELQLKS